MFDMLALIIWISLAVLVGIIAEEKGYSGIGFGFISLFAWFVVLIIVLCLPKRN